jgi:hypothetical protein
VTLAAVTPPVATGDSMPISGQGDYIITTGTGGAYSFQGSYSGFDGPVTVTAQLGDQVVTGSASGGSFTIDLPSAGNWQITLTDANGWQSVVIDTVWQIDDQPPVLTVDGPAERSTGDSLVDITGSAHDSQSAVQAVTIASERYPDISFGAALGSLGNFTGQVPLKPGENILTITAADIHANSSFKTISVTQTLSALPAIQITSPADGQTVTSRRIDVSGTVRSSLAAEKIRLVLNDQVIFPEGSDNLYSFTFHDVPLAAGSNRLTVRAETAYGNVEAQATVHCGSATGPAQSPKPRIEVLAPLPDTYLAAAPVVSGLVRSELGVKAVSVNGQVAAATGLGSPYVSFKAMPDLGAAADPVITIVATDLADQTSTVTFSVHLDTTAPLIVLQDTNLAPPPAVNTAAASPYVIAGTIAEAHLSGAAINDQPIALSPAGPADTYSFAADLPLTYGMDQRVTIAAWDLAGNRTDSQWIVRLDSNLAIEVIAPQDGAKLQATGEQTAVAVTVRVAGAQADDVFWAAVDNGAAQSLTRSGAVGNTVFNVSSAQAEHSLAVWVQNSAGAQLASTTTGFSLRNMDDVPLSVQQIKPANGAAGIEPNDFIAIYFNKPIDPAQLSLEVLETAHGKTYAALESGADITQLTQVALIEVNRDREPVPGGIAHFPVNRMAAFYPARDLAYGASVYVTATYAGQEVARAVFSVRPLPTFVEGTVQDNLRMGLAGIQVAIPELGLATTTDRDGGFGFGFKSSAAHTIPAGRYKVVANAQMADKNFGIGEQWVNVAAGRLNSMDVMLLAGLNPSIAFRRIVSGHAQTVLADGALVLDLSQAQLTFADLRDQGDVHVQLLNLDEIGHKPLASLTPYWMFAIQPAGIQVSGKVGLTIAVPTCNGTHAYVQSRGKYYILLGLDPVSLMIVPVGLAEFDYENRQMKSLQPAALQRLDYIGFAVAPAEAYPFIEQCALGEISFDQMVSGIENLR